MFPLSLEIVNTKNHQDAGKIYADRIVISVL